MRYSAQHKAETHGRLIRKAAEQFRRRGVQGIGIAGLMGQLGLTHGGFYAHFKNRDDLVAAVTGQIFEETIARMIAAAEAAPEGKKVRALVDSYLSTGHRDHVSLGCLLPALAGEMARQPQSVRSAYTRGLNDYFHRIARYMPGTRQEERCDQARLLLSGMAGAMMVARAMTDPESSDKLLDSARKFFGSAFERPSARTQKA